AGRVAARGADTVTRSWERADGAACRSVPIADGWRAMGTLGSVAQRYAVLREYARLAPGYDRRWSSYIQAGVRGTLARLGARPAGAVLDVGCGTGALLAALAQSEPPLGVRLAGLDPSPEMLAVARSKLAPAVELRGGWAEGIPYGDATFDVVVSCSVFHYLRRPMAALAEMARVLAPGGRLVITDWCDDY